MTFLAIDVGNTRLKWALYEAPAPKAKLLAQGAQFLEHIECLSEKHWACLQEPSSILGCSVAGNDVRVRVEEQLDLWNATPSWVVPSSYEGSPNETWLKNGYDAPSRLGSDRWVAALGARKYVLSRYGRRPIIVVMVGTAVTVDAINEEGLFLGGIILPGHGIMLRALEMKTAGLNVPTGTVCQFPKNTSDALTSGGTYAISGAAEKMIQHLRKHSGKTPVCLMTGGAAWKMISYMNCSFELRENLIFEGLLELAQKYTCLN